MATKKRADLGKPIDGFIAKRPPEQRAILKALCTIDGKMMCALGAHKSHVNLILVGPPGGFPDPAGRLEGKGKGGRHLKLRSLDELPKESVRKWLRIAAKEIQ